MAEPRKSGAVKAALACVVVLTLVGVLVGGTGVAVVLTPIVYLLLLFVMWRVPLRDSLLALTFFSFTLENHAEIFGAGIAQSPFWGVGGILLNHWNSLDRAALAPFSISGEEILIATLCVIALTRRSKMDSVGRVPTPRPLVRLAMLSLAGTGFVLLSGLVRGGTFRFALWQINAVVYVPVVFLLYHVGFRGPKDHRALAKVILAAATIRALAAIYIQASYSLPVDPETGSTKLPYATTHSDTMLFAAGFVLLLAVLMERVGRKARRTAFLLLPILFWGMLSNNRRMVWVQVALVMLTVYLVAPDNRWKKRLRWALATAAPAVVLYLYIGWDKAGGRLWKPVTLIRSIVDAKSDMSNLWRQLEDYDLITTIRHHAIFGVGYGNRYNEIVVLPKIDYDLERYLPHNSILGLWCYCGYIGYTAMTLLWVGGVYFAMRGYHATKDKEMRVAALTSFSAVLIYLIQCWGDMGLGAWTGVYLIGPGIAVAGKVAVATGQWPSKKPGPARGDLHESRNVRTEQAA